ncbi:MAG: hypothetical protein IKE55_12790 [Kiritimatiellae bacterium]|nr:hypothetical protein [Kiritimatiellia bacterium]
MFCFGDRQYSLIRYTPGQRYRVVTAFDASAQSQVIDGMDGKPAYSFAANQTYQSIASGKTLYLFALGHGTRAGGVACMTKARVYWLKMYQNDTLVRDYRPARQGGVYGLWEDVNGVFCGSATDTPFANNVPRFAQGEPDYYAQWIQSNGSTYIDTGVLARPETKIEAKFQLKAVEDVRLIGVSKGSAYFHIASGSNGEMWFRSGSSTVTVKGASFAVDTDYTVVADVHASSQTYSVTGPFGTITTNDTQTAVNTTPRTLFIFAQNGDGSYVGAYSRARLYSMKIWQDGVLVRDYVPGIKGGCGCLYDRVNDNCSFSNNGAITSAAGLVGPPAGVPSYPAYRLSYLGSEGNSYIDTGVLGNPGLVVKAEFEWTGPSPGDDQHVLGSFDKVDNGSTSWRCYPISLMPAGRASMFCFGTSTYNGWFTYSTGKKYRIVSDFGASAQSLTIDSKDGTPVFSRTVTDSYPAIASGKTLYLFALGHGTRAGGVACMTKARVYWLKMYQNGRLVHDYMPVIADNGGPYLYDKATRTFHQGATSGFWDVGEVGKQILQGSMISIW